MLIYSTFFKKYYTNRFAASIFFTGAGDDGAVTRIFITMINLLKDTVILNMCTTSLIRLLN